MISYKSKLLVSITPLCFFGHIFFINGRSMVKKKAIARHNPENRKQNPGKSRIEAFAHPFQPFPSHKNPDSRQKHRFQQKQQTKGYHPLSHGKRKDGHQSAIGINGHRKYKPDMPVTKRRAVPCQNIDYNDCRKQCKPYFLLQKSHPPLTWPAGKSNVFPACQAVFSPIYTIPAGRFQNKGITEMLERVNSLLTNL